MANGHPQSAQMHSVSITPGDDVLVSAAKRSPEAFGALYDRYYGAITRYIYHRTMDHAVTEDLTSNTFSSALRHIGRYRWRKTPFKAWLYRIATNEIRMHYRSKARRPTLSLDSDPTLLDGDVHEIRSVSSKPGDGLVEGEEVIALQKAVLTLKADYQTVISLRFFEDMPLTQIAMVTGCRPGTVRSQLHRGLKQLRAVLEQDDLFAEGSPQCQET